MEDIAVVYVNSAIKTAQQIRETNEAIGILFDAGVPRKRIKVLDVEAEKDIISWLMSHNDDRQEYPMCFVYTALIGNITALRNAFSNKSLHKLIIDGKPSPRSSVAYPAAHYDRWIDAAEWMVRGLAFGAANVTSFFAMSAKSSPDVTPNKLAKEPQDVDVEVVRTNWYWRHQKRIYRFCVTKFHRIDPETDEIKESFNYDDVQKVILSSEDQLVVKFKKAHPQYFKAANEESAEEIIRLILERAPENNSIEVTRE